MEIKAMMSDDTDGLIAETRRSLASTEVMIREMQAELESEKATFPHLTVPQHRRAAACLYGQPFGFTREDVTGLRERAVNSRESYRHVQDIMNTRIMHDAQRAYELFESLAARIEALLPSETK